MVGAVLFAVLVMACPRTAWSQPEQIMISGIVRDFEDSLLPWGHPDFESPDFNPGPKKYIGFLVETTLGADGKPVLATLDGTGTVVVKQWMDSLGRDISHTVYNPALGDTVGQTGMTTDVVIESQDSFNQWYNDVLGVNMSKYLPIIVKLQADGTYVFDSDVDEALRQHGRLLPHRRPALRQRGHRVQTRGAARRRGGSQLPLHLRGTLDVPVRRGRRAFLLLHGR
jgi:hypothetical protein